MVSRMFTSVQLKNEFFKITADQIKHLARIFSPANSFELSVEV